MQLLSILTLLLLAVLPVFVSPVLWARKKKEKSKASCQGLECSVAKMQVFQNGDWSNGTTIGLSKEECSLKSDLGEIVCPKMGQDATCSLFSSWGTRATSCADLKPDSNVFIVPRGRLFMLPAKKVGTKTEIQHLAKPTGKALVLETLSVEPRIFKVYNFFTEREADQLIANALSASDEKFKLKRSTISEAGKNFENPYRTSENAFDTNSEVAISIKKRFFDLLGIFPYDESLADGIQVLRYKPHTGYGHHMDWIEPSKERKKSSRSKAAKLGDAIYEHIGNNGAVLNYSSTGTGIDDAYMCADGQIATTGNAVVDAAARASGVTITCPDGSTPAGIGGPGPGGGMNVNVNVVKDDTSSVDDDNNLHDYDSSGEGTNRYATLLMYLSGSEEGCGGETVFPELEALLPSSSSSSSSSHSSSSTSDGQVAAAAAATTTASAAVAEVGTVSFTGTASIDTLTDMDKARELDTSPRGAGSDWALEDIPVEFKAAVVNMEHCKGDATITTIDQCIARYEELAKDTRYSSRSEFNTQKAVLQRYRTDLVTVKYLEARNMTHHYTIGSWEHSMLGDCRSRLAVKPRRLEALLFYSQHPDGRPNTKASHGGCPVLSGTKWAANLWVWNGPRDGYWNKNSKTGLRERPSASSVSVSFESIDVIGAKLFWEDQLWDDLLPGRPVKVNSFPGHNWRVRLDGEFIVTWTVESGKLSQRFVLTTDDLPSFS